MASLSGAYVTVEDLLELAFSSRSQRRNQRRLAKRTGLILSKSRGRGLDFDEVRQYQPGDDVRNIDWKVTARLQKPHTKIFKEEQERPCIFVVDQSQSMFFGSKVRLKSVLCAELLARLAWSSLLHKDKVGGLIQSNSDIDIIKPRRSKRTVAHLLNTTAISNQKLVASDRPGSDNQLIWERTLLSLRRMASTNNSLVFLSDFLTVNDDTWNRLLALRHHNHLKIYFLFDPLERELPPANRYSVSDGISTFEFNSGETRSKQQYRDRFEERVRKMQDDCTQFSIPFYALSTEDDLEQTVLNA